MARRKSKPAKSKPKPEQEPVPAQKPAAGPELPSRFGRWGWLLLLGPLLAVVLSLTLSYLWNEDFWWYLSSGQEILEQGGIPDEDPFLYTGENDAEWFYLSWLWTVIVALLERLGGLGAVVVFHGLVAAAVTGLVYTTARVDRLGLANALVTLLFLVTIRQRLCGKSELATWLLLIVFYRLLEHRDAFTWKRGGALTGLQVLWANLHGGYPLGVFAAACYSAGGWIERRLGRRHRRSGGEASEPVARPPVWVPLLLLALAVADPRMFWERLTPFGFFTGSEAVQPVGEAGTLLVLEWRSPFAMGDVYPLLPWLFIASAAVGLAGFAAVRPRSLPRLLFFLGMAVLGASGVRYLGGFALAAALVTLSNLGDRAQGARPLPKRAGKKAAEPGRGAGARRWLYPAAAAVLAACLLTAAVALRLARSGFDGGQPAGFFTARPSVAAPGAADFILEHNLPGPIFNDYLLGGYLGYRLRPEHRLFVDSRALDPRVVAEYTRMVASEQEWRRAEGRWGFRTAVLGNYSATVRSPLGATLDRDRRWRRVYVSPLAVIFVRQDASHVPSMERLRPDGDGSPRSPFLRPRALVPVLAALQRVFLDDFPANYLVEYLAILGQLGETNAVRELATEALEEVPGQPLVLRQRCAARFVGGDVAGALEDCGEAHRLLPEENEITVLYATVLERAGERQKAQGLVWEGLRREPGNPALLQLRERLGGSR